MIKSVFTLFLSVLAFNGLAQNNEVTNTYNYMRYGEFDKAKEAIDKAAKHEKTKDEAKTWKFRGDVYFSLDTSSKFTDIHPSPLNEALTSYEKAMELDDKDRYKGEIKQKILSMGSMFFNNGVQNYNQAIQAQSDEMYAKTMQNFENFMKTLDLLGEQRKALLGFLMQNDINPASVYLYAGYCARQLGETDKAIQYYNTAAKAKLPDVNTYSGLSSLYLESGDTTKALEALKMGKAVVKDKQNLRIAELKIYQETGRVDEMIANLKDAIEESPEDASLKLVLASTYDALAKEKMEDNPEKAKEYSKKALKAYEEAVALDPENADANFNAGISIYNTGVDILKKTEEMSDYKKIAEIEEQAKEKFRQALPYLEKACDIDCSDDTLHRTLKNIYIRLGKMEKVKEVSEKHKAASN